MKTASLVFLALLALPLRADDAPPQVKPDPFAPAKFTSLFLEKDEKGASATLQLVGDAVIYKTTQDGKLVENVTVHPDTDAWFDFVQGMNRAKVYLWAPRYEYPGQGISWTIHFATENRRFSSGGSNDFPKDGAEATPAADPKGQSSIAFDMYWDAALTLVGKKAAPKPSQ